MQKIIILVQFSHNNFNIKINNTIKAIDIVYQRLRRNLPCLGQHLICCPILFLFKGKLFSLFLG